MRNTRGKPCKRCGKPYRSGYPKEGQCECRPLPRSRDVLPALVGVYAQYAGPHDWVYIVKDVTQQKLVVFERYADGSEKVGWEPGLVRYYWDRHAWHQRWIPANHPRVKVCGYRRLQEAQRSIRVAYALRGSGAYVVDAKGNRL
jgi:hypothetical protein